MATQLAKADDKKISPAQNFRNMLQQVAPKLDAVLPKSISPQRFIEIAITTITKSPRLMDCDSMTVVRACIEASQLGLMIDGVLGHAYIVPYGKQAQLQVGYRGLTFMAMRTGEIKEIYADVVREGDMFEYEYGLDKYLRHKPCDGEGDISHAYAYAQFVNGGSVFTVMNRKQIDGIRKRSKASDNGPWVSDYHQMAKKTVMRNLCVRFLPLNTEQGHKLVQAAVRDERVEFGVENDSFDLPPAQQMETKTAEKTEKLKETLSDRVLTKDEAKSLTDTAEKAGWPQMKFTEAIFNKFGVAMYELKVSQLADALNLANGGV
jgi:recombination protein RecT